MTAPDSVESIQYLEMSEFSVILETRRAITKRQCINEKRAMTAEILRRRHGEGGGQCYDRLLGETDRSVICKWLHPESVHFLSQHGRASSNNEPLHAAYLVCPAGPPSIPA